MSLSTKPSILIITSGHPARNPRPVKEAQTLGAAGYAVTLLYVRNEVPCVEQDRALVDGAPFSTAYVDFLSPRLVPRLQSLLSRISARVARNLNAHGANLVSALGPTQSLLHAARAIDADLTIVHNEAPHWVGCKLINEGRRVAVDIEDWHSEDLLPSARRSRPMAALRRQESFLLNSAIYATTTSESMATALQTRYGGRRPSVVPNAFPLQSNPRRGAPSDPPSFVWFSQTVGPGRGLEAFINAWSRMTKTSKLVLLGEVAPDYVAHLLGSIPPERRAHLNFHPLVHPNHLPTFLASHDLGLALEDGLPPSRNLTITNKILQYLNAGLAVVCTDTAGQREVLQKGPEAGCIMDFSDASLAAAKLDHLIANASELGTAQRAARSLAEQHYCWERQSGALLLLVERAISLEQPKRAIIPPRSSDKHSLQNANTYSSDTPTLTSSRAQVISRLKYPARVFLHYLACLTAHLRARPLDLKSLGHTLIVAPHPDDESLGCGALIAKLASLNARVSVLFLTDSNGPNVAGASPIQSGCISQRQGEAIEACAQLGLPSTSLHFLHLIDGALTALLHDPEQKTVHMLATCLAEIAPDSVFITSRHDGSSEHEAACQMMIQAINTQAPKTGLYEYPIWSRWRPHLLLRSLRHYDSVFSVSIAAQREIKRRAIFCHGSQFLESSEGDKPPLSRSFPKFFLRGHEFFFTRHS